jgi:DNA-binding transcriptional ArsR family regulator
MSNNSHNLAIKKQSSSMSDRSIEANQLGAEEINDGQAEKICNIFSALADNTRVKIIYTLLHKEMCVSSLSNCLDISSSAISHQLRYLRNLRIVKRRRDGKRIYYSLDDQHISQLLCDCLEHIMEE